VPDYETSLYFSILALGLIKPQGVASFIIPNTFLVNVNARKYRENLINNFHIENITDLSNLNVFEDAKVRTCIINLQNKNESQTDFINIKKEKFTISTQINISLQDLQNGIDNWLTLFTSNKNSLVNKMKNFQELNQFCEVSQGLISYDKYRGQSQETIKSRVWHSNFQKDSTYKKELKGGDVKRYSLNWNGKNWISYGNWLATPRKQKFFTSPRILIREITNPLIFASYTESEFYNNPSIINILKRENIDLELKYILTLLNSKLMSWYHFQNSPKAKKGLFPKILISDVRNLPIPKIDIQEQKLFIKKSNALIQLNNKLHLAKQDFLSELELEKIPRKLQNFEKLELSEFIKYFSKLKKMKFKDKLAERKFKNEWKALFENDKDEVLQIQVEISRIENEIDNLVFKLYNLTDDEIKLVSSE
jgi:hypothetical protein